MRIRIIRLKLALFANTMYNFILQILIMLSLGTIIYLIARAAPRVGDVEESFKKETFHEKLDKLIAKIPFEKIDIFFSSNFEKILRKIKLWLMKWDNLLSEHLKRIKRSNDADVKEEKNIFFSLEEKEQKEEENK